MTEVRQFTALIEREGDGYVALCPELDIASQGDTGDSTRTVRCPITVSFASVRYSRSFGNQACPGRCSKCEHRATGSAAAVRRGRIPNTFPPEMHHAGRAR